METVVVIANWNGKEFLKECLNSLKLQTYHNFKTIIIDNGSTDGSFSFLKENYYEAEIIKLEKNTGFAHANNLAIRKAFEDKETKYIITLNNDTKTDPGYLKNLISCAKRHPEAGSFQPKVINFYDKNIIDSVGVLIYLDASAINRGQKEIDNGQYDDEEEIFGASASAALYTREALERIKLPGGDYFDSDYFAYYEDVDLAWRLRLDGFSSYYCPDAKVYHVHSATGKNYSPFKSFHIHRNQYYNIIKNLPFCFMLRALAFMPVRYSFQVYSILRKKGPAAKLSENAGKGGFIKLMSKSWWQVLQNLPILLKKRRFIQQNKKIKNSEAKVWLKKYKADFNKMIFN